MDETLEPINPITDTPFGALIIGNDVLCTPTSLCTWSDGEPEIYCRQPSHTLNPVCQTVNTGIGLIDCYSEPTCGGMTRPETTERILQKNPQYHGIIRNEEERQQPRLKLDYAWIVMIVMMIVLLLILIQYEYKRHRRRHVSRSRKR